MDSHAASLLPDFENTTSLTALDAFRITDASGAVVWARWSLVPLEPFAPANSADSGQADKNYLFDALIASVRAHPARWHLILTVAQPGDPTDNATIPWPPDRRQVDVGTLAIDGIESDDTSPARDINFDPLVLPDGIAASDDPLLSARSVTVYSQSFTRRRASARNRRQSRPPKPENDDGQSPTQFALQSRILHWLMAAMLLAMLFIGVTMVASLN